jgi:hypothetical protein
VGVGAGFIGLAAGGMTQFVGDSPGQQRGACHPKLSQQLGGAFRVGTKQIALKDGRSMTEECEGWGFGRPVRAVFERDALLSGRQNECPASQEGDWIFRKITPQSASIGFALMRPVVLSTEEL